MPRRKAVAAKGGTYTLHCEPGRYGLTGATPSFDPPDRAGLMLNRTRTALMTRPAASEADRTDVEDALRNVDGFLAAMRGHEDEMMRSAALRAIDAALLLGLNHGGGPDIARQAWAEAEAAGMVAAGRKQTKAGRDKLDEVDMNRRDAKLCRDVLKLLVFPLWDACEHLRRKYLKTWAKVRNDYRIDMLKHVSQGHRLLEPKTLQNYEFKAFSTMIDNRLKDLADDYDKERGFK